MSLSSLLSFFLSFCLDILCSQIGRIPCWISIAAASHSGPFSTQDRFPDEAKLLNHSAMAVLTPLYSSTWKGGAEKKKGKKNPSQK